MTKIFILFLCVLFISSAPDRCMATINSTQKVGWKTLKNYYGHWSINYPADWELVEDSGSTPTTDAQVTIQGPEKSVQKKQQIGVITIQKARTVPPNQKASLRDYIEFYYKNERLEPIPSFISEHQIEILGFSGLDTIVMEPSTKHTGKPSYKRWVVLKIGNDFFSLCYSEISADEKIRLSNKEWKYESVFNKILSTFIFLKYDQNLKPYDDVPARETK